MKQLRLKPDEVGNVEIIQQFWPEHSSQDSVMAIRTAPPLLIYADLITTIHPSVVDMLRELELIFNSFDIDCYLVGAFAPNIWLGEDNEIDSKRATYDVDIAVMMNGAGQFKEVKDACLATGNFTAHPTEVKRRA